ncbi:MAG: hypothetical protein AAF430_02500 [Myxococcota bacterium]
MASPQDLLREYAVLNRRRKGDDGVTPLEYQRWSDLRGKLEKTFPGRSAPGSEGRSRIRVEFECRDALADAAMFNVRPVGLFIATPFALESGIEFELLAVVEDTGERFETRCKVVSNNVGPDFSTAALGMGVRFRNAECPLGDLLAEICQES